MNRSTARSLLSLTRFGARLAWSRLTGAAYPFLVQLNVTNRCNFRCAYCYGSYFSRDKDELSLAGIKAVITALARAGTIRLNLVGGEPLLREDLGAIIDHAAAHGIMTAMTTNGSLVPARMDVVSRLGSVCFSLDGREEHNDLGRAPGSHRKVMLGLEACAKAGVPVQLSAVLTRHTLGDVDYLVDLAKAHQALVGFTPLISQTREQRTTSHALHPDLQALRHSLDHLCDLKTRGAPILFSRKTYAYCRDWPAPGQDVLPQGLPGFSPIPCRAGTAFCLIDANADLYPCPQLLGRLTVKNVLRDGLPAALAQARAHGCQACSIPCSTEFSLFFGMSPSVILDQIATRRKRS